MPVKLKPNQEPPYIAPTLRDGCVYKITSGYQAGWSFVKTAGNSIQYLAGNAGQSTGWDVSDVLDKPGTRYVEITLQEV